MLRGANSTFMARPGRGQPAAAWNLAAPQRPREMRGRIRAPRGVPAERRGGGGGGPGAHGGWTLSWLGGRARAGAGGCQSRAPWPRSSWSARGALVGSRERRESAHRRAQGTPRGVSWLPAGARKRGRGPGIPPGSTACCSADRSPCARVQHPPLNPPLPLNPLRLGRVSSRNGPPAGGSRGV